MKDTLQARQSIIDTCIEMNASGLNQGTSGNVSLRCDGGMLISPSGVAYDKMAPEEIVYVSKSGEYADDQVPSSEWRFHLAALEARPDANAVIHNHAMNSTIIAILNKPIPAIHYMVAAAGGTDIPCVDYATYGTPELSDHVSAGLKNRAAILMRHHGMIATGSTMAQAMWLAIEVEAIAKMYVNLLQITDNPPVLSDEQVGEVLKKFANYGLREKD